MRRFFIGCAAAGLLLAGGALAGSTVVEATAAPSAPAAVHPVVGAWQLKVEEFPDDPPSLVAFHADGTYQEADADGTVGIGSWTATGPSSLNLTFMAFVPDEGSAPMETIRATVEVSADGQTFTGQFTIELTGEGMPTGQYGPGHVTATRINVEPMGTPVGSLDDLFSQVGGPGTPAGTESMVTAPAGTEAAGGPGGTEPVATPAATEPAGTPAVTEPATTTMVAEPATTEAAVTTTT